MAQNNSIWRYPPIRHLANVEQAFRSLDLALSRLQQTLGSNDAYAAAWADSMLFPTRGSVYDKIEELVSDINALVSDTAYGPAWNGITAVAPSMNAVYDKIELLVAALAALPTEADGTYTPTLTAVANASAVTLGGNFIYTRQGSSVHGSGIINIDPVTVSTITQIGFTLPIASNLGSVYDLTGVIAALAIQGEAGGIFADTTNDRGNAHFVCADVTNHAYALQFDYRII